MSIAEAHVDTVKRILVTPEAARKWLSTNTHNRPTSPMVIARYRADMIAGRWLYAGDPVRFSDDGVLLDGQHRLMALASVEEEDFAIPLLVMWGLAAETQRVMDQGRKRTPGQQLALDGVKDYNIVAAAAKRYIIWHDGLMFRDTKAQGLITTPMIQEWVRNNPEKIALHDEVRGLFRRLFCAPSMAVTAAFIFSDIDRDAALRFFRELEHGVFTEGSPLLTLSKRLQRIDREGLRVTDRDMLSFFILAWNAWRAGRSMTKFQRPRGGSWSVKNFPKAV